MLYKDEIKATHLLFPCGNKKEGTCGFDEFFDLIKKDPNYGQGISSEWKEKATSYIDAINDKTALQDQDCEFTDIICPPKGTCLIKK